MTRFLGCTGNGAKWLALTGKREVAAKTGGLGSLHRHFRIGVNPTLDRGRAVARQLRIPLAAYPTAWGPRLRAASRDDTPKVVFRFWIRVERLKGNRGSLHFGRDDSVLGCGFKVADFRL